MPTTRRALLTGHAESEARIAITHHCLAKRNIHCQSCSDCCPEQAIRFTPRLGGPPLPIVVVSRCTGCGDCIAICPADALVFAPGGGHA